MGTAEMIMTMEVTEGGLSGKKNAKFHATCTESFYNFIIMKYYVCNNALFFIFVQMVPESLLLLLDS